MWRLIRTEVFKLRTTKMYLWLLLAASALTVLITSIRIGRSTSAELATLAHPGVLAGIVTNLDIMAVFGLILGALAVTNELRHGTITPVFLTAPKRGRIMAAKLTTYTVAALGVIVVALGLATAVAAVWLSAKGVSVNVDTAAVLAILRVLAVFSLAATLGVGLGALIRNQIAAVVGVLVWMLVVENLLRGLAPSWGRWLPFNGSRFFIDGHSAAALGSSGLSWWAGGIVFALYLIAAVVGGTVMLRRTDVA